MGGGIAERASPARGYLLLEYTLRGHIRLWYTRLVIKLRLDKVLAERGLTPYWLWKQTGIRWHSIWQMSKGDTARLHIETLDRICEALECQPGDLLVRVEAKTRRKLSRKKARKK